MQCLDTGASVRLQMRPARAGHHRDVCAAKDRNPNRTTRLAYISLRQRPDETAAMEWVCRGSCHKSRPACRCCRGSCVSAENHRAPEFAAAHANGKEGTPHEQSMTMSHRDWVLLDRHRLALWPQSGSRRLSAAMWCVSGGAMHGLSPRQATIRQAQ